MPTLKTSLLSPGARVAAITLALGLSMQLSAQGEIKLPPRQLLLEKTVELPSRTIKTNVVRIVLPKGYKTALHAHDGPGPRYLVKGKVKFEESGDSRVYNAGEVFWESGQWMTVENVGDEEAELIVFELTAPK